MKKKHTESHKINQLLNQLKHGKVSDRVEALESLTKIGDPRVVNQVVEVLSDRSPTVRRAAVECLASWEQTRPSLL